MSRAENEPQKPRASQKAATGRGSKEAIEKRRVARQLNALLTGGIKAGSKLDGRTEKRRLRLIKELKDGRSGKPLKPIDFVTHVDELLDLGESIASLKKAGVKPRKTELSPEILGAVERTQEAYQLRAESWKMLGVSLGQRGRKGKDVKDGAAPPKEGGRESKPPKRGRPRKNAAS